MSIGSGVTTWDLVIVVPNASPIDETDSVGMIFELDALVSYWGTLCVSSYSVL